MKNLFCSHCELAQNESFGNKKILYLKKCYSYLLEVNFFILTIGKIHDQHILNFLNVLKVLIYHYVQLVFQLQRTIVEI